MSVPALSSTLTWTPGSVAPDASVTVPLAVPVSDVSARAAGTQAIRAAAHSAPRSQRALANDARGLDPVELREVLPDPRRAVGDHPRLVVLLERLAVAAVEIVE